MVGPKGAGVYEELPRRDPLPRQIETLPTPLRFPLRFQACIRAGPGYPDAVSQVGSCLMPIKYDVFESNVTADPDDYAAVVQIGGSKAV